MKRGIEDLKEREKIKEGGLRQNRGEWKNGEEDYGGRLSQSETEKVREWETDNEEDWWWKWRERGRIQLNPASRRQTVSSYALSASHGSFSSFSSWCLVLFRWLVGDNRLE